MSMTLTSPEQTGERSAESPFLEVRRVSHQYRLGGRLIAVLREISFLLSQESFAAIIGPSGSGKSTLLGLIAGLEEPSSGSILLDGSARRLGLVGYMPQRDLLHPWRTALDNATVALEVRGVPRQQARRAAAPLFEAFGLASFERARPHELSGGMRQRVALARTLLAAGDLILLDEPFGALDALTRASMQDWLTAMWPALGRTGLLVTHDVEEALFLADDVYVLSPRPGRIIAHVRPGFAQPRTRQLLADPRFGELKLELLRALSAATGEE